LSNKPLWLSPTPANGAEEKRIKGRCAESGRAAGGVAKLQRTGRARSLLAIATITSGAWLSVRGHRGLARAILEAAEITASQTDGAKAIQALI
jgi:hypothetical protein